MHLAAINVHYEPFIVHKGPRPIQTSQRLRFAPRSLNIRKMQVSTKAASEHTVITIGEALYGMST